MVEGEVEGDGPSTFGRVGLAMALVPAFEEVAWYGRGPHETYPDSMTAGRVGPLSGGRRRARDAVCRASRERPPQRCALVPLLGRPPWGPGGGRSLDRFQRPPLVDGCPGGRGP